MSLSNQNNGTAHHAEMYIKDSVGSLTLGYSNNYVSDAWKGGWVYSTSGPLMLKATNSDVEIFAGGTTDADRALILDTSLNATFYGNVQLNNQLTINRTGTGATSWELKTSHYGASDYGSLFLDSNLATGNFYIRDSS